MQQRLLLTTLFTGLIGHVLFQLGNNVLLDDFNQTRIDGLVYQEERLTVHRIDPIVGRRAQTELLSRHIVFG